MALVWGGIALFLIAVSPWAEVFAGNLWACRFKTWTGYACPTCGTTRAAVALANFDFVSAFSYYPLQALGWALFLVGGLMAAGMALIGKPLPSFPRRLPMWARASVVVALLLNWAYSIATGV